jgi:hypothetical protein
LRGASLLHDVLGVRLVADDPSGHAIDLPGVAVVEFNGGFHVSTRTSGRAGSLIGWPEPDTPVPESVGTDSVQR